MQEQKITFKIPRIVHQLWIGTKPAPTNMMITWKQKHSDFEYILWTEDEIAKRGITFVCQKQIDEMNEINGKADIMRWEILYKYGGFFVDADCICIEPFDDYFSNCVAFATYENESIRKELIATGTMGFIPEYPLCKDIIEWIRGETVESIDLLKNVRAWGSVGPGALTRFLETGKYKDFSVYPSHCFLPIHFTGSEYTGHKKVYAFQAWGTANQNYGAMNDIALPIQLLEPIFYVSVLIPSYNTRLDYIKECLESIKCQTGHFGIELVWINDGSSPEYSSVLENELREFEKRVRFCKVVYHAMPENMGISYCLHEGVKMCTNEYIFRMDSDDIMFPTRIQSQLRVMKQNTEYVMCGTNVRTFRNDDMANIRKKTMLRNTSHPAVVTFDNVIRNNMTWFMNHPTLCFRKSAVLKVGNYDYSHGKKYLKEDYDLEIRILEKYGAVYNLPEVLLLYRIHEGQLSWEQQDDVTDPVTPP